MRHAADALIECCGLPSVLLLTHLQGSMTVCAAFHEGGPERNPLQHSDGASVPVGFRAFAEFRAEGGGAKRGPASRPGSGPALRAPAPGPQGLREIPVGDLSESRVADGRDTR